jgi:hypothetical protein
MHIQSEGHVSSKLLLEKWNLGSDEGGIKLDWDFSIEKFVHGNLIQTEFTDWGLGNGVNHARESALGKNDLREGLRVHEAHVVWVKNAGFWSVSMFSFFQSLAWWVSKFSKEVHINVTLSNEWWLSVSEIKIEGSTWVLASKWWLKDNASGVVVKRLVHYWAHHVRKDVISDEVHWVLNDNDSEIHKLMHDKSHNLVIMVQIGLSELDIAIINDWIKITILVENQISLEINVKILEDKLNLTLAW